MKEWHFFLCILCIEELARFSCEKFCKPFKYEALVTIYQFLVDQVLFTKMKRSVDDILNEMTPLKSTEKYNKAWQQFVDYVELNDRKPNEDDFMQFFDYLKNTKKMASSTIWSKYSMINNKYQILFGGKLQSFPRITILLKSYEAGYVRKTASIFNKSQIFNFLENAPNTGEFIHIKVAVLVCYYGGLRCADLVNINNDDFEFNEVSGMWINYNVSKQKGEVIKNKFNIPLEFCQYLENYDHALADCSASEGRLMKCFRRHQDGSGYYTKQPMGVHLKVEIKS